MATLYIREYAKLAKDADGNTIEAGEEPAIADQTVTFTTSAQSAAFNRSTRFVLLKADADAHILFGANPTATTSQFRLEADVAMFFGLNADLVALGTLEVAAYDGTS